MNDEEVLSINILERLSVGKDNVSVNVVCVKIRGIKNSLIFFLNVDNKCNINK